MEDEAAVAEEGTLALDERTVGVEVGGLVGVLGRFDEAVLATKIADLASLGARVVTGDGLAADVGVKMRPGAGAVAVRRDRSRVNVVGLRLLVLKY